MAELEASGLEGAERALLLAASSNAESSAMAIGEEDVRLFRHSLSRLRSLAHSDSELSETLFVASHERLAEVVKQLQQVLLKWPAFRSSELVDSASRLVAVVRSMPNELVISDEDKLNFLQAVDRVDNAFASRIVAAATNDDFEINQESSSTSLKTPSLSPSHLDNLLIQHESGVDCALDCAKKVSKYIKDVMGYVERRSQLQLDFAKKLSREAQRMRPALKEENFLPFQSIFCTTLDHDLELCARSSEACGQLLASASSSIGPSQSSLQQQQSDSLYSVWRREKKLREELKARWKRELQRMKEQVSALKKNQTAYEERHREHRQCRDTVQIAEQGAELGATEAGKLDKRRRHEEEALHRLIDSENLYRESVINANEAHHRLLELRKHIIQQIRVQLLQCDYALQNFTVNFFRLQYDVVSVMPVQFQTLGESSRAFEPGSQYNEFVRSLIAQVDELNVFRAIAAEEPFKFKAAGSLTGERHQQQVDSSDLNIGGGSESASWFTAGSYNKLRSLVGVDVQRDNSQSTGAGGTSTATAAAAESDSESRESRDTSPSGSPLTTTRRMPSSAGLVLESDDVDSKPQRFSTLSSSNTITAMTTSSTTGSVVPSSSIVFQSTPAAATHRFSRLKKPSRCRECKEIIYIYLGSLECQACGLCVHKKCAETLQIECGHKRLPRKFNIFGVDLSQHLLECGTTVPPLVCKCVLEIEKRGINVEGLYRISSAKGKERLCQRFESGLELADISEDAPKDIANVLKQYLRDLPEPLITFDLYPDLIALTTKYFANDDLNLNSHEAMMTSLPTTVEENSGNADNDIRLCLHEMSELVQSRLPPSHLRTLGFLMHHLKRVHEANETNKMPARNLAISFGPTLMRTSEGPESATSVKALAASNDQIQKTIELLILYASEIFGPPESVLPKDYYTRYAGLRSKQMHQTGMHKNTKSSLEGNSSTVDNAKSSNELGSTVAVGAPSSSGGENESESEMEAIPAEWLEPSSSTSFKPRIIRADLGTFTGLEGVTRDSLSTQDSMDALAATKKLAKQASAEVTTMVEKPTTTTITTTTSSNSQRRSVPQMAMSLSTANNPLTAFSRTAKNNSDVSKEAQGKDTLSSQSKGTVSTNLVGVKKHSLDEEYLQQVSSSNTINDNATLTTTYPSSSSYNVVSLVTPLRPPSSSPSSSSSNSSTNANTCNTTRSSSLSEENRAACGLSIDQRRRFLASGPISNPTGSSGLAYYSNPRRSSAHSAPSTSVHTTTTFFPSSSGNKVKIQIKHQQPHQQPQLQQQHHGPVTKQRSIDKGDS